MKQDIAKRFLPPLVASLRRRFPSLADPHLWETAAIDALLDYFGRPERFDPERGDLMGYLYVIGSRDLLNALDKQRRELARRTTPDHEPVWAPPKRSFDSALVEKAFSHIANPQDEQLLILMMEGVRDTAAYARELGIADRPAEEQTTIVKRHKDRLKVTLRRRLRRARLLIPVWLLTTRQRATAMVKRAIPTLAQVIAVAVLVGTQVFVWSVLRLTGDAKSFASGPSIASTRHFDGEEASINGVSGRFAEKILFISDRGSEPNHNHIWMVNPDGSSPEQLTFGEGNDGGPSISPDGLKLAFARVAPLRDPNGQHAVSIWVKDLVTGSETIVTLADERPSGPFGHPEWSPDGRQLALDRGPVVVDDIPEGYVSIWIIDVGDDGGISRRVTPTGNFGYSNPVWSPDGRHLLVDKQMAADSKLAIYRIDVGTGIEEKVIPYAGDEYQPKYSPDGMKVLWTTNRHTHPSDGRSDVYVADLRDPIGTQRRLLPYSGWSTASWSPDGSRIVMVHPKFKLTDESLRGVEKLGLTHWMVERLSSVKHNYFADGNELVAEVQAIIGDAGDARVTAKILQRCSTVSTLCVVNADGSGLTTLLDSSANQYAPIWGIVFVPGG